MLNKTLASILQFWPAIIVDEMPRDAHWFVHVSFLLSVQMGILPTDTYPALVCDIEARKAVERLYAAKDMEPTKQLSILVKNYADINTYTLGFPSTELGQDTFRLARRALPGPVMAHNFGVCTLIAIFCGGGGINKQGGLMVRAGTRQAGILEAAGIMEAMGSRSPCRSCAGELWACVLKALAVSRLIGCCVKYCLQ